MKVDLILTLVTLAAAVIGTILDKPSTKTKALLIACAVAASFGSIVKAYGDYQEKDFLRKAATSSLVPNGAVYGYMADAITSEARKKFRLGAPLCYHDADGMTCFFRSRTNPAKRATVVFDRADVSDLYADYIQDHAYGNDIDRIFTRSYNPAALTEAFEEDAAILGAAILYRGLHLWPSYSYDDEGGSGLRLFYSAPHTEAAVAFTRGELAQIKEGPAAEVFFEVDEKIRQKLVEQKVLPASENSYH
jgi:hypothetical protein